MKNIFLITLFAALTFTVVACNNQSKETQEAQSDALTYTCPMHPEVISHEAGSCPQCRMDLVLKDESSPTDSKNESHDSSGHEGHNH